VRHEHDVRILDEARVDGRLVLVDVEAAGGYVAFVESGHEGFLIDDSASGCVDDYNAFFHLGEFGGGEDVVRGGLVLLLALPFIEGVEEVVMFLGLV
jgi:hypothetical protein